MATTEQATEKQAEEALEYGSDLVYKARQWERLQYEWARGEHEGLKDCELNGANKTSAFPVFQREEFSRLIGGIPKLEETSPEAAWARKVHTMLDELPEWQTMRERCKNDEYAAACATAGLSSRVLELLPKHDNDAQRAREMKELLEEDLANGELTDPDQLDAARDALERAVGEIEGIADSLDPSALRNAARAAIEEANDELDDIDNAMAATGWGQDNTETSTRQGAEMKAAVAKVLRDSEKLARVMEMAGRMQNVWKDVKATKPSRGSAELTDIETGNDLARLLPSEAVAMRHPKMKLALWRKLCERNAMQYKLEAKDPEAQGPIVVCVDDSGSMAGDREVWAKGLAMGLMLMARDQKRAFAYCAFSNDLTVTVSETTASRMTPAEMLTALEQFRGGGTNFEPPMTWGLDQIEKDGTLNKADVVLISDGSCLHRDVKGLRDRAEKLGARVWGLAVGPDAIGQTSEGSMQSFCERVWPVSDVVPGKTNTQETEAIRGVMGV